MLAQNDEEEDWVDDVLDAMEIENEDNSQFNEVESEGEGEERPDDGEFSVAESGQSEEEEEIEDIDTGGRGLTMPAFSGMRLYEKIPPQLKNSYSKFESTARSNTFTNRRPVGSSANRSRQCHLTGQSESSRVVDARLDMI